MAEEGQSGGGGGGNSGQVVVVKKKGKHPEHPHHGGAWKVAYADFVTAMMAFFLLLWLLSTTTKEQKMGIAHYFNPPNNSTQMGGGSGIMGGNSVVATEGHAPTETPVVPPSAQNKDDIAVQVSEDAMFRQVSDDLKKQVMNVPELKAMSENLQIDLTPEGLRITISDSKGRPLFENGSAKMFDYTQKMVAVVANVLSSLTNDLSVGGHTDSVPYRGADLAYTNWELSADRAQTARRILVREGIPERRMARVAGYAGQQPMVPDHPESEKNRRLTIIVLRGRQGPVAKFTQEGLQANPPARQEAPQEPQRETEQRPIVMP